ncbi:MAG: hypothetical protein MJK15_01830 [Colwellia sp.]|nr:hypothetical protein [Colwellia sp.]
MQLATLLKNMFVDDDYKGTAIDFAKLKNPSEITDFNLNIDDDNNQLLKYLIWPMNTFHLIAWIFDTYDVYQKIVSLENDNNGLRQLSTGNHARNWSNALRSATTHNEINVSSRFYKLLFKLFSASKARVQIEELLEDPEYLDLLLELYVESDKCADSIRNELHQKTNALIHRYVGVLSAINDRSIISSLSQCNKSNGVIQFKSLVPQSGISLNSLSHNLAYIKPGIKVAAIVGKSPHQIKPNEYHILVLPWPLEVNDEFFKPDNTPSLQMNEEFGFFAYENRQKITHQMIEYAIESSGETNLLDLIVIPECAVHSNDKTELIKGLKYYFSKRDIQPPVIIFGVFGNGDGKGSYGENSLELLYQNRFSELYDSENQKKHHRWALDKTQLQTYGLSHLLSEEKVKLWENCSTGGRKLISYRNDHIHLCPLICEDLARQEPIAPVVRALGPDLVIALLLDGPQIKQRWPGTYAKMLTEEPGSSVLSITSFGMTQRSTGAINPETKENYSPSFDVALWSDATGNQRSIELDEGKIGVLLQLKFIEAEQWTADGRREDKNRLVYSMHKSIGDDVELGKLSQKERFTVSA